MIQKAHHSKLGVIIFERPGDAMFYFSTEDVDNLKRLREMVTENLINEADYADAKGTILAVARILISVFDLYLSLSFANSKEV